MTYNNLWLIERYKKGEKLKFIFFWGHGADDSGMITKSCFSQWWRSPFVVNGLTYNTAEHWMMAEKARLFQDEDTRSRVLAANSPGQVKAFGRSIKAFDANMWDQHKFDIVVQGNIHKFSQHAPLKAFLLDTKERILVEASPVDTIWGIGLAADNAHIENPMKWKGENLLGYALMEVRDTLRKTT